MILSVELSVTQMQHINGLFAQNPSATHVTVTREEYADARRSTTKAALKAPSKENKKGKTTYNYLEEVLLTD